MAQPVIVYGDTSLILVDTSALTAGQSAVVLLSSIMYPGYTVTVRDSIGYLSSPQKIIISTQRGVQFADGTSSSVITQPYGFLSMTSRDPTSWNITNSFGFPERQTIASVDALTASSITASNVYSKTSLTASTLTTGTLLATSSLTVNGPTYASTLLIGAPTLTSNLLRTDPGYAIYSQGSMKVFGNMSVEGQGYFSGNLSTGSNLYVLGSISSLGSLGIRGDIMTLGGLYTPSGSVITSNLDIRGGATIGGPIVCANSVSVGSNLFVGGQISSFSLTTSSVQLASSITFNEKYITYRTADLLFSDAITVPGISTLNLAASNGIVTSNLTVTGSITAPEASQLLLSSTAIVNPGGSMTLSSLATQTATFSNIVSTMQINASSLTASTITLGGNLDAAAGGYLSINTGIFSSITTGLVYATSVDAQRFTTTGFTLADLNVTSSFVADNVTSFSAVNVTIDNTGGSISTGTLAINSLLTTSTIVNTSGQFFTNSGTIRMVANNVIMNAASVSSLTTSSITATALTATAIEMGSPPTPGIHGPYFVLDSSYPQVNVSVTGGPGDSFSPFLVTSVKPPGINPGDPYPVEVSFSLNFNGPTLPGYYATVQAFSLIPGPEANCLVSLRTENDATNITTLYGLYGTNQSYSTPPDTGGIPIPSGTLPSSFLHVIGTMYGNSEFSIQFQSRSNDNYSGIDSNTSITMNNGVLRWPYFLNGTTIQNSLNDMAVRSIYYYGALNFASDPALKERIEYANLSTCSQRIAELPLRRFKYIDSYLSTFQQKDTHRLGFLANEVEAAFPKSVTYTEIPELHSTFRMIDTQQIEMSHIGATQHLMKRVDHLYSTIASLKEQILTEHGKNLPHL